MERVKHILIVDDVTTNLRCVGAILKDYYKVSMVKSGEQAFQFLKNTIPDLILLDISMPEMDGYQVMEKIHQNDCCNRIPIIFLTADTNQDSALKGIEMGAVDYIMKPFEPDDMIKRIRKALELYETPK